MKISLVKKSQLYFLCSFAGLIILGTAMLRAPFCLKGEGTLGWLDAVFLSSSAVCVTGLQAVSVLDLTWTGQLTVLILIQLGGIGIMTLSASIMLLLGHHLSYSGTLMIKNTGGKISNRGTEDLFRVVLYYTLICESAGFAALWIFLSSDPNIPYLQAAWYALFHSVSAFCNAGFILYPNNMPEVSGWLKIVLAMVFIAGGLGVYVIYDIRSAWRSALEDVRWQMPSAEAGLRQQGRELVRAVWIGIRALAGGRVRLTVQTRLVLYWTAGLLLAGTVCLWWVDHSSPSPIGWTDAFFLSAACRTAGFCALDMTVISYGGLAVLILLMLIGAAPGSTGGGMKVTTFALVMGGLFSTFKGTQQVILFKRAVPPEDVLKAFVLLVTYLLLTASGAILLWRLTPGCTMKWALFESASALATVGFELENPVPLTAAGKGLLIAFMFIGRVGIFTFFLFLLGRERRSALVYPEERMIVS